MHQYIAVMAQSDTKEEERNRNLPTSEPFLGNYVGWIFVKYKCRKIYDELEYM